MDVKDSPSNRGKNPALASRTVVILQPSYWPWRGYFEQIRRADHFVFLDNVQFDKRGWRNRNRIKTSAGPAWFSVPVAQKGRRHQRISEVEIVNDRPWGNKHIHLLRHNYSKTAHYAYYAREVDELLGRRWQRFLDLAVTTTLWAAATLGIHTNFHTASDLTDIDDPTGRLVSICSRLGATRYLTGPAAKAYLERVQFEDAGIEIEFASHDYPAYPQLHGAFEDHMSILDLLFNCGPESLQYLHGTTS